MQRELPWMRACWAMNAPARSEKYSASATLSGRAGLKTSATCSSTLESAHAPRVWRRGWWPERNRAAASLLGRAKVARARADRVGYSSPCGRALPQAARRNGRAGTCDLIRPPTTGCPPRGTGCEPRATRRQGTDGLERHRIGLHREREIGSGRLGAALSARTGMLGRSVGSRGAAGFE